MDETKQQSKYISIRIPEEELKRVDAAARECGLNRSDYVRSCLKNTPVLNDTAELARLTEILRQLQAGQSAYVQALSRMFDLAKEQAPLDEDYRVLKSAVTAEITRGSELQQLLFKAERRTVRLLRQLERRIK